MISNQLTRISGFRNEVTINPFLFFYSSKRSAKKGTNKKEGEALIKKTKQI